MPVSAAPLLTALLALSSAVPDRPEITERRIVGVSPDALAESQPVSLDLFGTELVAEPSRIETTADGKTIWLGRVRDRADSLVAFVASGGRVTGHVAVDGETYAIRPLADGTHALDRVDVSELPDELPPVEPKRKEPGPCPDAPGEPSEPGAPSVAAADGIDTIRLLVVYTPGADDALVDAESSIQLAVTLTNVAFTNSLVATPVELAGTAEVDFATSDLWMGSQLVQMTSPDDGIADEIHALRDDLEADVVMLVSDARGACGISNLLLDLSIDSAADAFSITHHSCMGAGYTFTHELGHALGAGHERQAGCVGLFPYSCGYRREGPVNFWRTVMAYPCAGTTCPRILHFSSPDVFYLGEPTGIGGDPSVATDNAKTLALAAPTVASFRGPSLVPRDVRASENLLEGVRVSWTAPVLPAAAYRVQRFERWSDEAPSAEWTVGSSPFLDDTIAPNGERYYRVAAFTSSLVQGPASSLVRGFRRSASCGNGRPDAASGEQCDGGSCCDGDCLIRPDAICGRPVTGPLDATCSSSVPTAADCLRIFNASAGLEPCEPACICDVNGDSNARGITPTDALACLAAAVGGDVALECSCTEPE